MALKETVSSWREFIIWWNNQHPVDKWWRDKYQVPFNSPTHRAMCIIDMKIEYEEETIINDLRKKAVKRIKDQKKYEETGNWLKISKCKYDDKEVDDFYNNIDLASFNTNINIE